MDLKIQPLLLLKTSEYNYISQTTSCNIQKRHGNIITKTTMNSTKNTSIQNENNKQAWTRYIPSKLDIQTNHSEKKDYKIPSMKLSINAIQTAANIHECMTMHELQAMSQDQHLHCLRYYIIQGWPESRDQIIKEDTRHLEMTCQSLMGSL